mmetsp:Transcript_3052/g.4888  ORF Transcript_3052/g.4888 Transcript_3052/m.4888 type:complete len:297 (-) Transcript_3052:18-908(-)
MCVHVCVHAASLYPHLSSAYTPQGLYCRRIVPLRKIPPLPTPQHLLPMPVAIVCSLLAHVALEVSNALRVVRSPASTPAIATAAVPPHSRVPRAPASRPLCASPVVVNFLCALARRLAVSIQVPSHGVDAPHHRCVSHHWQLREQQQIFEEEAAVKHYSPPVEVSVQRALALALCLRHPRPGVLLPPPPRPAVAHGVVPPSPPCPLCVSQHVASAQRVPCCVFGRRLLPRHAFPVPFLPRQQLLAPPATALHRLELLSPFHEPVHMPPLPRPRPSLPPSPLQLSSPLPFQRRPRYR